jgi:DNA repair exonuclease SbcCD ATPase subunit
MSELQYERNTTLTRSKSEKKMDSKAILKYAAWLSALGIWAFVVFAGYNAAQTYIGNINQQLSAIDQRLAANHQEQKQNAELFSAGLSDIQAKMETQREIATVLQQQLTALEGELELVKEEMSLAGSTLNSSDETKKALSLRINDLSKELGELRKLIKKLEEAARVY